MANRFPTAAVLAAVIVVSGCSDSGPQLSCPDLLESIRHRAAEISKAEDFVMTNGTTDLAKSCALVKASIANSDKLKSQVADFRKRCITATSFFDESTINRAVGLSEDATLSRSYVKEGLCR